MDVSNKFFQGENTKVVRGDLVNLSQLDPTLRSLMIAGGWETKSLEGNPVDVDLCCFLLDKNGQTRLDSDFVFYNNITGCEGAVRHTGDSRTGAGDGDDETMFLDFNGVPYDVAKIIIAISIYDGYGREQNLTMVRSAFVRLVNRESGQELLRYFLDPDMTDPKATAFVVGALEREGPKWIFTAIGEEERGGLAKIATSYGIIVA